MKKFLSVATVVLMILAITACTTVLPGMATSNPIGSKVGEASYSMILGIPLPLFSQDIGIQTAAQNGGITKISTIDTKVYTILGFYSTITTVVTGE